MHQWEKEFIAKIQISQLVSEDPYKNDFYYQIYTSLSTSSSQKPEGTKETEDTVINKRGGRQRQRNMTSAAKMQQQMQKLIERRKQKTKGTSCKLFHFV